MRNLWDDGEAERHVGDWGQCAWAARLLARDGSLLARDGWSASVKVGTTDVFGQEETLVAVSRLGQDPATVRGEDLVPMRLQRLVHLLELDALPGPQLAKEIRLSATDPLSPPASLDTFLHAALPYRYVYRAQFDPVSAVANTPDGGQRLQQIYGDAVPIVPYTRAGFSLAKVCARAVAAGAMDQMAGLVLMQNGIVSFGDTARLAYDRLVDLVTQAEQYLISRGVWPVSVPAAQRLDRPVRHELAALRHAISTQAGAPLIMQTRADDLSLSFAQREDVGHISQQGPAAPEHIARTRCVPMIGRDLDGYTGAHGNDAMEHPLDSERESHWDPAPRVVIDPEYGVSTLGRTPEEAALAGEIYRHTIAIMLAASGLGEYRPVPVGEGVLENMHAAQAASCEQVKPQLFAGEVALVTGAASGIGKACAEALMARGAAVVGLDIHPGIVQSLPGPGFLGLQCDVTDEQALCEALEAAVQAFGGLDILVPNAGIFPPGCRIDSLTSADWEKVMRVNLDANLNLMREAYPLLKVAPRHGRVVIVGSRNVPAPGPGAVAYSASKAALVQLGRVAALEWGADGIRVNMVNPHAVFDTGIWTDQVLKARADYYGMTVEQYKRNNVLRVEITSRDVGELVAEMCGPLFAMTTGAQVPIDGGSDRVI